MIKSNYIYTLILVASLLFTSCSEYQKTLKNTDVKAKYDLAEKLYDSGDYKRALRLFEQIAPSYVGKPQGERILYFFADAYYQTEDYYLAAYQFERFSKSYPRSDKAEEAAFLSAKSKFMLSPKYSNDQTETNEAIDKLQIFINNYPSSDYMSEANEMARELRNKLDKKAFEVAKQYNTLSDYKASIKSFELFLSDSPGSIYREDALFYKMTAEYNLAVNSIYARMEERLSAAKSTYTTLLKYFPETKYQKDADKMLAVIDNELQKFSK
ncbi:Beta-barrel assembly machine subunit BamD [Zhouia amylolytica]|uniref:Beta-barrel assembly machine subunit BamD n=1 Tax=Zhouia amylolytica TaxID=376730 RepID=A0A1I6QXG3_9FLAO|nr:outer membrane protein assembly factor BamD [Zhouia amylolytica]SFS57060.1 Beta-barrel assembly machine subunit BamD [Zhouia amylolytica]